MAASKRGYADTPLGQLHYVEQGTGVPILLLHQTPRSWDEFRELQPLLAADCRTIAMDMLGFGLSAEPGGEQSIESMARGAFALLDALDVPRAVVMGHHTGGAVAIEMAASAPARVIGLVLSSAPWTDSSYRESHADGPGVDEAERTDDGSHLMRLWALRQPYYPAGGAALLDRFIRDALAPGVDPAEGHRACARYVMEERIGLVVAPTLLLGATEDPFALPDVERLRHHLTGASHTAVELIDGGMIPLMEQKAPEVAACVRAFVAELAVTSPNQQPQEGVAP